ncbi:MAG: alpha,alpha-phosphotrehalase [Clostridia bacterium]|nr:alpha,alpha-phosphotrehalase [Clostridia bacterium]
MLNFQDKVVYQIYPRSFCDSNGDGIGDLNGITSKLDYLASLGVDYLWLTPFFRSPQRDNGYDVADYCSVDPVFGTMEDAERLLREADQRGIGLMLDMVFNHTSTQHVWFQRALAGDKTYQDYYLFRDGAPDAPPTNWQSKFGGSAWEYVPKLKKWYLHLFDVTQADLNWENPAVREELKQVIRFWQGKGVKGFRFDVVNLISKPETMTDDLQGDGRRMYTDGRHVHQFLQELTRDTGMDSMLTVGEMSSTTLEQCIRYSNPDRRELSMVFNFHHLKIDYKNGDKWAMQSPDIGQLRQLFDVWQTGMQQGNGWNAVFWCNHDQPRIVSRLGDDRQYWQESAKMLALCIHFMRGTPYIYQGEELGMTNAYFEDIGQYRDVESLNYHRILTAQGRTEQEVRTLLQARSRDNSRTPMQWDESPTAGFTDGTPWIPLPQYKPEANVQAQAQAPASILSFYKRLICLRKEYPLIARGDIRFLCPDAQDVIAYCRGLDGKKLFVYCNFSAREKRVPCPGNVHFLIGSYEQPPQMTADEIVLRPYEGCAMMV